MEGLGAIEVDRLLLILAVFVWKNERKELHLLVVKEFKVLSMGLRSAFMVAKRALGLVEPE